jgi:hypothetical protein
MKLSISAAFLEKSQAMGSHERTIAILPNPIRGCSSFQRMLLLQLPPLFGVIDNTAIAGEQKMIGPTSKKLSMQTIIALIAMGGGCVPAAADYTDYGGSDYYGNIYNDDGTMNPPTGSTADGGSVDPLTGNQCSIDSTGNQNCGGSP